jgi:hypothetical protein
MKELAFVLLIWISAVCFAVGQTGGVQKEISAISNKQLVGQPQGILWKVDLVSEAGDKVIQQAVKLPLAAERDNITNQLVTLLTDTTKGIAVHFILCEIWKKQVPYGSKSRSDTAGLIECTYGDLTFYQCEGRMFATKEDLLVNQNKWRDFLRK